MTDAPRISLRDRTVTDLLALLRTHPGMTRSGLAAAAGISRSSVIHSVARLLREGRIEERMADEGGAGTGRPAHRLYPVPVGLPVGGIDFGHQHIGVVLADPLGQEIASEVVEFDVDLNAQEAIERAKTVLERLRRAHDVDALGSLVAGIPGPVDATSGLVTSSTILSGWVGIDPAAALTASLGVEVRVENDAVLGAFAEHRFGAARGHRDILYVKASGGIGAALVLNGAAYKGATGLAGEIGHTRLANSNELCRCGKRGCLEAVVSSLTIRRQLEHAHPGTCYDSLYDLPADDLVTVRIFNEAGRVLGGVFSDLCNLINPSLLVVGGTLGSAHPALVEGVRSSIDRFAQPAVAACVDIVAAGLGDRAELMGAVALAVEQAHV